MTLFVESLSAVVSRSRSSRRRGRQVRRRGALVVSSGFEPLEDRTLLSANLYTVNVLTDSSGSSGGSGTGTTGDLRYCIALADLAANAGSTIQFSVKGAISLASALGGLTLSQNVTIDGPGASSLTVAGTGASGFGSVFTVNSGVTAGISGLTISGGNAYHGGGISSFNATLTLTNDTLSGNSAGSGGGLYSSSGTVTLTNDTFSGNSASYAAGGIDNYFATMTLTNDTLSGNSTVQGGGIVNIGTLTLTNDTLSGNSASYAGGGIYDFGGTVRPGNTVIAGNTATTADPDVYGSLTSQGHNLIGKTDGSSGWLSSDLTGTVASPLDPGLDFLADNGGPTQTIALLPGSPAIDAGSTTVPNYPATDQRGIARVGTPDIGAFESRGFSITVSGGDGQSATVNTAFAQPLAVTVTSSYGEPVAGGVVTFTAPGSGASATLTGSPATIGADGVASVTAAADGTVGSYTVTAAAAGSSNAPGFSLTNSSGVVAQAELSVTIAGPSTTLAGTDLSYMVTIANNGPDDAQSVSLSGLTVPAGTVFVSYTAAPGWSSTPAPAVGATSGSITASIGTLSAGASGTFTFRVQVNGFTPGGTPIALTATASSSTADPTPNDNNNVATGTSTVTLTGAGLATNLANPAQVDLVGDGNTVAFATVGSQIGVVVNGTYDGAFSPTGRLVAYGRGPNDRITVSSTITVPATLYGSGGGDTLVAGGGNSVLVGGGGSATLISGAGHNILISGGGSVGASKIVNGMAGNNIMIGGSTDWDHNDQALGSLLAEWGRTDLPSSTSYATRVSDLLNGGGLNGSFTLNSTTVHDNGVRDVLIGGGAGQNWYLAHVSGVGVLDIIIGKKNTETVTAI